MDVKKEVAIRFVTRVSSIVCFGLFINTYRDKSVEIFLLQPPFLVAIHRLLLLTARKQKSTLKIKESQWGNF